MINLKYINKVCICLEDNESRFNHVHNYIVPAFKDDINIKYTHKHPCYNVLYKDLNFQYSGQLGCAISHYDVIYEAYYNKQQYLLVCEDDITFNINQIQEFLNKAPYNFDILQFFAVDCMFLPCGNTVFKEDLEKQFNNSIYWVQVTENCKRWGTVMYILNRKGMEFYLDCQKDILRISDYPFIISYEYGINHYIPTLTLINEAGFKSSVVTNIERYE